MEVKCHRCETSANIPLDAIRRPRDTPIWKLEGSFRCRSCGTRRYKPPVHIIKLTEAREIAPYVWGSSGRCPVTARRSCIRNHRTSVKLLDRTRQSWDLWKLARLPKKAGIF